MLRTYVIRYRYDIVDIDDIVQTASIMNIHVGKSISTRYRPYRHKVKTPSMQNNV